MKTHSGVLIVATLCTSAVAQAQQPQGPESPQVRKEGNWFGDDDVKASVSGFYRLSHLQLGAMRVDAEGHAYGQSHLLSHRLAFQPAVELHDAVDLQADFQLATGFLSWDPTRATFRNGEAGANWGPPRGADGAAFGSDQQWRDQLRVRQLYVSWLTPVGLVRVGRQVSKWGLGILANDGDDELQDWGSPRFGQDRGYGDVVDRMLFATRPFVFLSDAAWVQRWTLAVGADLLVRDERFVRTDGDLGWQAVGVLRYERKQREIGAYVAYRDLRDRNDDTMQVWAADLFGRGAWRVGDYEVGGAGELVWANGDATLGRNNAFPNSTMRVQQLGFAGRVGARSLTWGTNAGGDVAVGYASGDSNPNDRFLRAFSFDPDFNPSLILFEELHAAQTAAAAAHAADPAHQGVPADSVRLLPSAGSVTNAIYVRPTVRLFVAEDLEARIALLWARAEEDVVDPYGSNANAGGAAVNYQGGDASRRQLGVEVDVGVDYTVQLDRWAEASLGVQAGRLWPGDAFADAAGARPKPINLGYLRLVLRWLPAS